MNLLDEYRRNAQECQRMADNAGNSADRASWLKLAASWLGMIKNDVRRPFAHQDPDEHDARSGQSVWRSASDEDSKASH